MAVSNTTVLPSRCLHLLKDTLVYLSPCDPGMGDQRVRKAHWEHHQLCLYRDVSMLYFAGVEKICCRARELLGDETSQTIQGAQERCDANSEPCGTMHSRIGEPLRSAQI